MVHSVLFVSVMCHCDGRAFEAIVGHKSHILLNEQGGIAQVSTLLSICIFHESIVSKEDPCKHFAFVITIYV